MNDYEFDISFDYKSKRHTLFLDLGEQSITLTREELEEMLNALDEADLSK
jgi:hypothetical protein